MSEHQITMDEYMLMLGIKEAAKALTTLFKNIYSGMCEVAQDIEMSLEQVADMLSDITAEECEIISSKPKCSYPVYKSSLKHTSIRVSNKPYYKARGCLR